MFSNFRQRLRQGEQLLGTLISLNSPAAVEVLAAAGFDWLFLDAEHAALEPSGWQALLQAAGPAMPCLIRVPALDEAALKHALDCGAAGVIVPQVHTAEQAAQAGQWAHYPPQGTRGVGVARAHGYGFQVAEYLQQANAQITVVVQAESAEAARNIDAIVRAPGVDAVLIGPYDLSASLGRPGDLGHPEVRAAISRIAEACRAAGVPAGIFGLTAAAIRPFMAQGFQLLAAGVDTVLLGQAARDLVRAARE